MATNQPNFQLQLCLEVRDLVLVRAIAGAGGVTAAARVLHLSQSAVSHHLRDLEQRLSIELFTRQGRSLQITAPGKRLVQVAHDFLTPLSQVERELREPTPVQPRSLRLATFCYTAYHWLPLVIERFAQLHPDVQLDLVDPDEALLATDNGQARKFDVALCLERGPAHLKSVPLFNDQLVLAVCPAHPLAQRAYVDGKDLRAETFISGVTTRIGRERVKKLLFGTGPSFAKVTRVPSEEARLDLVRAGIGVAILPHFALRPRIARGEITAVRLTRRGVNRRWYATYPRNATLEAPLHTLVTVLKECAP